MDDLMMARIKALVPKGMKMNEDVFPVFLETLEALSIIKNDPGNFDTQIKMAQDQFIKYDGVLRVETPSFDFRDLEIENAFAKVIINANVSSIYAIPDKEDGVRLELIFKDLFVKDIPASNNPMRSFKK